jgi:hypothetical protein
VLRLLWQHTISGKVRWRPSVVGGFLLRCNKVLEIIRENP